MLDNLFLLDYTEDVLSVRGASGGVLERGRIGACGRSATRAPGSGGRRPIREAAAARLRSARPTLRWGRATAHGCAGETLPAASAEASGPKSPRGTPGHRHSQTKKSRRPGVPLPLFEASHSGRKDRESDEARAHSHVFRAIGPAAIPGRIRRARPVIDRACQGAASCPAHRCAQRCVSWFGCKAAMVRPCGCRSMHPRARPPEPATSCADRPRGRRK